jgi:Tfp pilus assembly protein PilN
MTGANLMPPDGGGRGPGVKLRERPELPRPPRSAGPLLVAVGVLLGVLVIAIAGVLEHNQANDQRATLAALQARIQIAQATVARLSRAGDVLTRSNQLASDLQQIAGTRFNWYSALTGFGEVISPHTYFTSLTSVPSGSSGNAGTAARSAATGGITFTLRGCTGSQDQVAVVMRQLRQIRGVVSVSETTGSTGVQLNSSERPIASKAAQEGKPTTCSDGFVMSIQFVAPTLENNGR